MGVDDLESWIGRSSTRSALLDPRQADLLNATLGRDAEFAEGDALPLAFGWLYFPDAVPRTRLGADGHPLRGVTMPPVALPRRMWASGSFHRERSLRFGDEVTRISTIESITPKRGRTGELCFVTVRHEYSDAQGMALGEKQVIVYREDAPSARTTVRPIAPEGDDLHEDWAFDEVALFRYSALTFNGHRIHYDVDYARGVEGYPGLVIHGPLEATLLCELLRTHGVDVDDFAYQARSPVFLPEGITTHAVRDGDGHRLWVTGQGDGGLLMSGMAR
jgi:3-methylfumaryl-CoA hydratase